MLFKSRVLGQLDALQRAQAATLPVSTLVPVSTLAVLCQCLHQHFALCSLQLRSLPGLHHDRRCALWAGSGAFQGRDDEHKHHEIVSVGVYQSVSQSVWCILLPIHITLTNDLYTVLLR